MNMFGCNFKNISIETHKNKKDRFCKDLRKEPDPLFYLAIQFAYQVTYGWLSLKRWTL